MDYHNYIGMFGESEKVHKEIEEIKRELGEI